MDMEQISEIAQTWLITGGTKVVMAIAVLVIGWMIAGMIRGAVRKAMNRANVDATLIPFASSMTYYLVMAFVAIAVLRVFGVEVASVIAVLGAAAFAVGLALQGTLSNFAAGVMLLVFRPFRVGEVVEVAGQIGKVEAIQIFSTIMSTPDNVQVIVPNATIWGDTIKNYAANDTRRVDMVVGVGYGDDLNVAGDIIKRVVEGDSRVLKDPAVTIAVSEMADSSVNFVVRPWCKKEDYWGVKFDLTKALKEQLEAGGCSIPYPQTDVHLFKQEASA